MCECMMYEVYISVISVKNVYYTYIQNRLCNCIIKGGNDMKVYINNVLATAEDWNYLFVLISQNRQRIVSIHYADKGVMITTEE